MVVWLIPLLCVVGLLRLWWDVAVQLQRPRPPACGKCGYNVAALTTMHCPECGGDFRTVGITAPHLAKRVHSALFGVAWTLLLPLPLWLACIMLFSMVWGDRQSAMEVASFTAVTLGVLIYVVGWMAFLAARRKLARRDAAWLAGGVAEAEPRPTATDGMG